MCIRTEEDKDGNRDTKDRRDNEIEGKYGYCKNYTVQCKNISDLTVSMFAVCRIVCGMFRMYCHHRNQTPVTSPVQGCLLPPRALLQPSTSSQQP